MKSPLYFYLPKMENYSGKIESSIWIVPTLDFLNTEDYKGGNSNGIFYFDMKMCYSLVLFFRIRLYMQKHVHLLYVLYNFMGCLNLYEDMNFFLKIFILQID